MCLYPRFAPNPKYLPNKKNGGKPPKCTDERKKYVPIKCGECEECRKAMAREWTIRLNEELRIYNGWYITLTFSEESLIKLDSITEQESNYKENDIATKATRLFLERWRKKYKKSCRHWFITELGHENTERVHLHGIILNTEAEKISKIKEVWQYGWVDIGEYCNSQTINYIVKYITKIDKDHPKFKGKILASPGLGSNYIKREPLLNIYRGENTKEYYRTKEGYKLPLPIYYRNQIYTENQREELWIQKIEKGERYITGTKYEYKTQKDMENYANALKKAQEDNIKHGYEKIEWNEKEYKKALKIINKEKEVKEWEITLKEIDYIKNSTLF